MTPREPMECPFCGDNLIRVEPWHGGGPNKHMVRCDSDECEVIPSVTGETRDEAVKRWNTRDGRVHDA